MTSERKDKVQCSAPGADSPQQRTVSEVGRGVDWPFGNGNVITCAVRVRSRKESEERSRSRIGVQQEQKDGGRWSAVVVVRRMD